MKVIFPFFFLCLNSFRSSFSSLLKLFFCTFLNYFFSLKTFFIIHFLTFLKKMVFKRKAAGNLNKGQEENIDDTLSTPVRKSQRISNRQNKKNQSKLVHCLF